MITIGIPVYKARDTLPYCLDALVAQTRKMFLVTLCQDCDGEDYSDIIETYRARGLHIRLISTSENSGPGVARQTIIDNETQSDYIMFCDSDDILQPRAVEQLYREAKRNNADVVCGSFIHEENFGPRHSLPVDRIPCTWLHAKIYRLDYLRKNNICFLPELRLNEDSYFNLVACNCTDKMYKLDEYFYIWRSNPNSLTRQDKGTFFQRSNGQYIYGQVKGLKKIYEIRGDIPAPVLCQTLINIYNAMMEQVYRKVDDYSYLDELLSLKQNSFIQDFLKDGNNWPYFVNNVKAACIYDNDVVYFYKLRFVDFITNYVMEDKK